MKTRSASDGMVWITPARVRMVWPSRGRLQARMPSGTATAMAAASDTATRKRCSNVRRPIRWTALRTFASSATPNLSRRKSAATCASGTCPSSARAFIAIMSAGEMAPSNRASARAAVVFEHDQIGSLDLRVRRVQVGGGDVAGAQGAVGELVVHSPHVRVGEPVNLTEARPSILAAEEFVGEADLKLALL